MPQSASSCTIGRRVGWAAIFLIVVSARAGGPSIQTAAFGQGTNPSPTSQRSPLPPQYVADSLRKDSLERVKLSEEINKLRIESENSERSFRTIRGWENFIYTNISLLAAIVLGFWTLWKYRRERADERRKRDEERFEAIVKALGSEHDQERVGAAGLLFTFLRSGYERFYSQVFDVVVGQLRMGDRVRLGSHPAENTPASNERRGTDGGASGALTYALASVLRIAYPLARKALPLTDEERKKNPSYAGQHLNASGVHLKRAYLAGADFKDAWLRRASLRKANLRTAVLTNANLESSDLAGADLRDASIYSANLMGANLSHAKLTGAFLSGSLAHGVDFSHANLVGVTFEKGYAPGADFSGADLSGANFSGVSFAVDPEYPVYSRSANPEAAEKLDEANFVGAIGLTDGQKARMREKHAKVDPEAPSATTLSPPSRSPGSDLHST